jgi:hypothetical protein
MTQICSRLLQKHEHGESVFLVSVVSGWNACVCDAIAFFQFDVSRMCFLLACGFVLLSSLKA